MAPTMIELAKRQYGYGYGYGNSYGYYSPWNSYGRWILLAAIIVAAFLIFLLFSCITARRRRRTGLKPYAGTGWASRPTANSQYQNNQGYYGNQQGYNMNGYPNNNNNTTSNYAPPAYGQQQNGVADYNGQYAPPTGPPPVKTH